MHAEFAACMYTKHVQTLLLLALPGKEGASILRAITVREGNPHSPSVTRSSPKGLGEYSSAVRASTCGHVIVMRMIGIVFAQRSPYMERISYMMLHYVLSRTGLKNRLPWV